ncbi:MAG TPA: heat-inducible transcriptional repressor HrcA [Limnochordia bacterium]|jgi:heat-inducible transcriptional repressor|nr:heat-inducible transcriptional repressor HrcA [Limnochordia bacterium]HPZ30983.1 heat-inducible transcriptional repressor HrcA [Limnochordia bacterium]HQD70791.1 heat-inducible transcriptional repressor HrcA [Limnochordia bacterium]
MLNERKIMVLHAIVDDYIRSAEPVGSRTIARRYNLGVSPATIRNEMADLEEIGYIIQPHISAGRIPSDKGYRFYVDVLMEPWVIPEQQRSDIQRRMETHKHEIELLVQEVSKLLSVLTNYVAVVLAPQIDLCMLERVQLMALDDYRVLVILVLHPGLVQNRIIRMPVKYDPEALPKISRQLTKRLQGVTYRDLRATLIKEIQGDYGELGSALLEVIASELADTKQEKVFLSGAISIFEQPEFRDLERAKGLLSLLEQKETVSNLINTLSRYSGVQVTIGRENPIEEIHECSVVTSTYSIGGEVIGAIGVIGPTRMEYANTYSVVEMLADSISEILSELIK